MKRRTKILATVREMLEELGYKGMKIRDLAKRAGVAQGTLYNRFGGKDGLVLAAADELLAQLSASDGQDAAVEGLEAIFARSRLVGAQIEATPRYADAMTRILFRVGPDDPLVDVLFARSFPFLKAQLETAQKNGEVRPDVDTDLVARHLVGQQWGVVLLWMMGLIPTQDNAMERQRSEVMTLIGIATDSTRKRLEARLAELGKD